MRIVFKNGIPCKVDGQGRLIASNYRPFGGRYGEPTITVRIPISIAGSVLELCDAVAQNYRVEKLSALDNPAYTTPGFEDAKIYSADGRPCNE